MFPIIALLDFHSYIIRSTLSYGRFPCSQRRQACLPSTKKFSGKSGSKVNRARLFVLFQRKMSGSDEHLKSRHVFLDGIYQTKIRIESHL